MDVTNTFECPLDCIFLSFEEAILRALSSVETRLRSGKSVNISHKSGEICVECPDLLGRDKFYYVPLQSIPSKSVSGVIDPEKKKENKELQSYIKTLEDRIQDLESQLIIPYDGQTVMVWNTEECDIEPRISTGKILLQCYVHASEKSSLRFWKHWRPLTNKERGEK